MNPLFCYTSGRWLWNEREQLKARYRRFDVPSLQQAACQAVGADKCISFEKIGEGNYNKARRLEMEGGQRVIAKLPHPNAGPRVLTTASEVATMEFARTILNIPVPLLGVLPNKTLSKRNVLLWRKREAPNSTRSGTIFHYGGRLTSFVSL